MEQNNENQKIENVCACGATTSNFMVKQMVTEFNTPNWSINGRYTPLSSLRLSRQILGQKILLLLFTLPFPFVDKLIKSPLPFPHPPHTYPTSTQWSYNLLVFHHGRIGSPSDLSAIDVDKFPFGERPRVARPTTVEPLRFRFVDSRHFKF